MPIDKAQYELITLPQHAQYISLAWIFLVSYYIIALWKYGLGTGYNKL